MPHNTTNQQTVNKSYIYKQDLAFIKHSQPVEMHNKTSENIFCSVSNFSLLFKAF